MRFLRAGITSLEEFKLSNDAIGFDPSNVLRAMEEELPPLYDHRTQRWVGWPSENAEQSDCPQEKLAKFANSIGRAVALTMNMNDAPRKWTAKYCSTPVPDERARCQWSPHNALMNAFDADSSDSTKGWANVFAVAEFSSGNMPERLARSAQPIFDWQRDRACVLGFTCPQNQFRHLILPLSVSIVYDDLYVAVCHSAEQFGATLEYVRVSARGHVLTEEFCKSSFLVGPGVETGVGAEAQCNVEEDTCC